MGYHHGCAVTTGKIRCWGRNAEGEVGNPAVNLGTVNTFVAVDVIRLTEVVAVCAHHHTCAVERSGKAWCWGVRHGPWSEGAVRPDRGICTEDTAKTAAIWSNGAWSSRVGTGNPRGGRDDGGTQHRTVCEDLVGRSLSWQRPAYDG